MTIERRRLKVNLYKIYNEDCLKILKRMPDKFVNCCVTSPPYYGLRDYGTARWVGGDPNCDHIEKFTKHAGEKADRDQTSQIFYAKTICPKCGAVRIDKQIGLEETPEQYVQKLVAIFREVKRVLKDDGTLWLNLGDSYWGGGWRGAKINDNSGKIQKGHKGTHCGETMPNLKGKNGIYKPKDLIGIPWMVAFALRADGWYLRQDIIWHKPNPMPESVTDRCTKAHEYIFLLSKSQRYYYDADAIKEKMANSSFSRMQYPRYNENSKGATGNYAVVSSDYGNKNEENRNKRSVWTVNTKPYKEAHFATYPEKLIVPCIKAGCPEDGIVYDPFMGAGTTALVAHRLNRRWIGSELNPEYVKIAEKRLLNYKSSNRFFNEYNL